MLHWRPLPYAVAVSLIALVMAWTFLATPRYRSSALLQLTEQDGAGGLLSDALSSVPGGSMLGGLGGLGEDGLETEMGVLRSRRVVDAVMDSLALTVRRESPATGRDSIVAVRIVPDVAEAEGLLRFERDDDGGFTVEAEDLEPELTLPERVAIGDSLQVGNAVIRLLPTLREYGEDEFTLRLRPRYETRRAIIERLEVLRPSSGAKLIAITFDDPDPSVAARALEVMIAEYLGYTDRSATGDARYTVANLRLSLDTLNRELRAAEEAVRRYQERTGLVVPEVQAEAQVKRYATLKAQQDALSLERDALRRMLTLVGERAQGGERTAAYRQLATFPTLISNRAIQDLLVALTELENDRSALLLLRSEQNADVRQLTNRITEIETSLQQLGTQYLEALDGQLAPVDTALAAMDAELLLLPERQTTLVRLLREAKMLSEGYVALQAQLRQTEVLDAIRRDAVRVVDAPEAAHPDDPQFPKPLVHLALALVLGLSAAGAIVALRGALVTAAPER